MAEPLAEALQTKMPVVPKGQRMTGEQISSALTQFQPQKAQYEKDIAAATGEEALAKQKQAEIKSAGMKGAEEAYGKAERGAMQQFEERKRAEPLPAFVPTQDNAQDMAGLFSLINVIGMVVGGGGKHNAQLAMNAMNGMLEGYQKGRGDLYKRERDTFEKNFKTMIQKHKEFREDMEDAIRLAATDKRAGIAAAEEAAVKAGSDIIKAQIKKGNLIGAYNNLKETEKSANKALEMFNANINAERQEEAADRRAEKSRQARIDAANLKSLAGPRSAINERYATTVYRSANEVLRSLELIEQIGISTGGGALGGVVGKGTIPSEVQRYIGQAMTNEQERNYNSAMSGIALELAYVLNGGYKPDQGTVNKIETLLSVGPNDTVGNAAYKFADVSAKLKAAIEVNPAYTEDQKNIREKLMKKLDRYVTPEVVYQRVYGVPERKESVVRSGEYPKPQTQEEFDALEPGTEYIDPDDNKVYTKRGK